MQATFTAGCQPAHAPRPASTQVLIVPPRTIIPPAYRVVLENKLMCGGEEFYVPGSTHKSWNKEWPVLRIMERQVGSALQQVGAQGGSSQLRLPAELQRGAQLWSRLGQPCWFGAHGHGVSPRLPCHGAAAHSRPCPACLLLAPHPQEAMGMPGVHEEVFDCSAAVHVHQPFGAGAYPPVAGAYPQVCDDKREALRLAADAMRSA